MDSQGGMAGKWPIKNVVDYEIEDLLEGDVHHAFIDYHEYLFDQVQELLKLEPMSDSDIQLTRMTLKRWRLLQPYFKPRKGIIQTNLHCVINNKVHR